MKYCPNCLKLATISPIASQGWGYGCESCEILAYSPSVLLDSPDVEKSKKYKLTEYMKRNVNYMADPERCAEEIIEILK